MAVIGEAFIDVKPRSENFGKETDKQVTKSVSGGGLATAAKAIGVALATGAAFHFVDGFVKAAQESQKISRVTDAIIKSTGGAAQLTADQVGNLATKLSNLSGVDDELIQSSENILLTFTNVRDAAGAGNDIFSRTTEAALNMATVLGGDPTSSIQQLGKALNDPAEGLTKLTRAGVVFTDQQKDQVKQLQAAGDLLGAQKVVLAELDKEFGGAAAAAADPFERLKVVVGNLQEAIGGALIPVLAPAATGLANLITENQESIAGGLTRTLGLLGDVVAFLKPGAENLGRAIGFVFDKVTDLVGAVAGFLQDHAPNLSKFFADNTPLAEGLSTAVVGIGTAFAGLAVAGAASSSLAGPFAVLGSLGSAAGGLAGTLGAVSAPVLGVAAAILAAAAAGEVLFQKVDLVRGAFESLFGDTLAPFAAALTFLNPFVPLAVGAKFLFDNVQPVHDAVEGLVGLFQDLAGTVADLVSGLGLGDLFASISDTLGSIDLSGITDALGPALAQIGGIAAGVGAAIGDGFSTAVAAIRDSIGPAVAFLTGLWAKYGDQVTGILVGFRDIAVAVFGRAAAIVGVFFGQIANLVGFITSSLEPAFRFLAATVAIAISPLGAIIGGALRLARVAFETFVGVVGPMWSALWGLVTDVVSAVIGPISDIIEGFLTIIQGVVDVIAGIFTGDWSRIWDGVSEVVSGAIEIVVGVLEEMLGFLGAVWSNAGTLLALPFTTAWTVIQGLIDAGVIALQTALQGVIDFVTSVWGNIGTLLSAPVEIAYNAVVGLLNAFLLLFTALPGQVTDALTSFPTLLVDLGSKLIDGLKSGVDTAMKAVSDFFTGLGDAIAGFVGDLSSKLVSAGESLIHGLVTGVDVIFGSVIHFFSNLGTGIADFVGDLGGALVDAGAAVIQGLIDGIRSKAIDLKNAVIDVVSGAGLGDAIGGGIGDLLGGLRDLARVPHGAAGMVIPGQSGQPFALIAHGGELLINPNQIANLAFNLANARLPLAGGGASQPTFVDASIHDNTIVGVADFQAMLDQQAERLADIFSSGRRGVPA